MGKLIFIYIKKFVWLGEIRSHWIDIYKENVYRISTQLSLYSHVEE